MKELKGHFEARLAAYNRVGSGDKLTLLLHPQELPTELLGLPLGARLTIAWVAIGDDEKPALAQPVAKEKVSGKDIRFDVPLSNLADQLRRKTRCFHDLSLREQAVLRCKDERFQAWLHNTHGQVFDEADAVLVVRDQCGVQSRRELDTNEDAAAKWKILNDAFETEVMGYAEMVR